jgi:thiol-disulfide isomerase/thioredoxin
MTYGRSSLSHGRSSLSRPLATLLACLLLAGCTADPDVPGGLPAQGSVDVDTPALRALKADAGVRPCRGGDARPVPDGLPEVALQCLGGGRPVTLSSLRGPLVITLFAQWCGPCRKELPYFQRLDRQADGAVRVLGVDYLDTQPDGALRLAQRSGVTFPLLADPETQLRSGLRVRGIPTVVFVDADGVVTASQARAFTSYADLREAVRDQLGVEVPA